MKNLTMFVSVILVTATVACSAEMPTGKEYTNFIGMKFVRIEPGEFEMGQLKTLPWEILPHNHGRGDRIDGLIDGDFDERPVHTVRISSPLYMGVFEVTNLQYELFDPGHKRLRGKEGFSTDDNSAGVNVNWYEAQAFCRWLSDKEGLPCRLPTEAEWEYACRAGTKTNFYTGDVLPREFLKRPAGSAAGVTALHAGQTPANGWGLYDMHGNVEEWCYDWYGPYTHAAQTDPVGYINGHCRVTRGGSQGTQVYSLRSANRQGTLPEDKHWFIGLRVVIGELPGTKPLPAPPLPLRQQNVIQRDRAEVSKGPDPDRPYFKGPRKYVIIPKELTGPIFASHNHSPAIVECPNGDLLATWFTCLSERNRELAVAGSRLRWGSDRWDRAEQFFDTPDRNNVAPSMWFDGDKTIYFWTGVSIGEEYSEMAEVMMTSTDSGATWSRPQLVAPDHVRGQGPGECIFRLRDGTVGAGCDWMGGSKLLLARDGFRGWRPTEGIIRGIHAPIAQGDDGRLLAFGRGGEIEGKMPMSISADLGNTWTYHPSPWPGIDGGQRSVLIKLRQGPGPHFATRRKMGTPLMFASFANKGINITDASGERREVWGLFAALSTDDGKTWPHVRLVSDDGPGRAVECTNGGLFNMCQTNGEYQGYLSVCQSLHGLVHLISSRQHYAFNLKWLETPQPAISHPPLKVKHVVETFTGPDFDADGWVHYRNYTGGFDGKGQYTVKSLDRVNGINRLTGKGSFEAAFTVSNIKINPGDGGVTPGPRIMFRDARTRRMSLRFDKERIALDIVDEETSSPLRFDRQDQVRYSTPPRLAKARLIWNENKRQWRIFYGLNGDEPTTELPQSKAGIYFGKPLSETTAVYLVVDHGRADFDHFEIKPINP
ncbi:MAG: SUMF1/EgtB/PvdO family nonheme iron enzyme [Planctomycetota bacterium]|jgi:formylglycine-generating enzyme required for sulfatase activity